MANSPGNGRQGMVSHAYYDQVGVITAQGGIVAITVYIVFMCKLGSSPGVAAYNSTNTAAEGFGKMRRNIARADKHYPAGYHSSLRQAPICTFSHLSFAGSTGLRVSAE